MRKDEEEGTLLTNQHKPPRSGNTRELGRVAFGVDKGFKSRIPGASFYKVSVRNVNESRVDEDVEPLTKQYSKRS
jgi:hypothetical protein